MVFFSCDGCGEMLKKAQVDNHANRCRRCQSVSCVDCSVSFFGGQSVFTLYNCFGSLGILLFCVIWLYNYGLDRHVALGEIQNVLIKLWWQHATKYLVQLRWHTHYAHATCITLSHSDCRCTVQFQSTHRWLQRTYVLYFRSRKIRETSFDKEEW